MRLTLLIACAAAVSAGTAAAHQLDMRYQTSAQGYGQQARLSCRVSGDPIDYPDDLWVVNKGPAALPAGTRVGWSVMRRSGEHTLKAALPVGRGVRISRALPGGTTPASPCRAAVTG